MDGNDAPGALDAELLEESCCDDGVGGCEGVGVEKGAADYGDEDDAEASAEDLGTVANGGSTSLHSISVFKFNFEESSTYHGPEVGNDLGDLWASSVNLCQMVETTAQERSGAGGKVLFPGHS